MTSSHFMKFTRLVELASGCGHIGCRSGNGGGHSLPPSSAELEKGADAAKVSFCESAYVVVGTDLPIWPPGI